ncbi:hypothetical protein AJ88_35065 [Mesorhizobium amorphae CCBAU 01583]|nr:hypothetical protein AJ88_35065 [Mesorhizobium amorphae CCBAU 01583]
MGYEFVPHLSPELSDKKKQQACCPAAKPIRAGYGRGVLAQMFYGRPTQLRTHQRECASQSARQNLITYLLQSPSSRDEE